MLKAKALVGSVFQEYKPYMFWMNMIDAFYQSLICFFIPYFVSVFLVSIVFWDIFRWICFPY